MENRPGGGDRAATGIDVDDTARELDGVARPIDPVGHSAPESADKGTAVPYHAGDSARDSSAEEDLGELPGKGEQAPLVNGLALADSGGAVARPSVAQALSRVISSGTTFANSKRRNPLSSFG